MEILLATGNEGKVSEIKFILADFLKFHTIKAINPSIKITGDHVLVSLGDILKDGFSHLEMPEETGKTYTENSELKAVALAKATSMITIADDSGLEVFALDGRPGLYSSRYGNTDSDRIQRLLSELEGRLPAPARFVCVATLATPDGKVHSFEGVVEGDIVSSCSGASGFGFDPVFKVKDRNSTMAQLAAEEKNKISHRAVAFQKLFAHLFS